MYLDIRQKYWWSKMKQDIARYIEECDVCRRVKAEHQKPAGLLQPLPIPEWKWDKIQMDFVTGLPKSQKGNDAIFVVIDQFSKVAHFLPVKETITASQLQPCISPKLCHSMAFRRRSVQTAAVFSLLSSGIVSKRQWELILPGALLIIPNPKAKSSESIKFLKTCFELVLFLSARSGKNLSLMRSSLITTAIKPA